MRACVEALARCESAVDAAQSGLPVRELRAQLEAMQVSRSELARCIEREDLVSLLQSKVHHERLALAMAAAAEVVATELEAGLAVPLACGCPTALRVGRCSFSREPDGVRLRSLASSLGSPWGSQHAFHIDERTTLSVSQLVTSVYEWENQQLARLDLRVPMLGDDDAAAAVAHACAVTLGSEDDHFAAAVLTPNLCMVWRADADRAVARLARSLNWPKVRLLFVGHREAAPADAAGSTVADAAGATAGDGAAGGAAVAVGCPFALLDRELLCLIAEWLVVLDAKDGRCGRG